MLSQLIELTNIREMPQIIHVAAANGCVEVIKEYLKDEHLNAHMYRTYNGNTALHVAIQNKQWEVALLLAHLYRNHSCQNDENKNPLHYMMDENLDIIDRIAGYNKDWIVARDINNITPIEMLLHNKRPLVAVALLKRYYTHSQWTAHFSAIQGNAKNITIENHLQKDPLGFTPLHVACLAKNYNIIKHLLTFEKNSAKEVALIGILPLELLILKI